MPSSSALTNGHQPPTTLELTMSDDALVTFGQPVGSDGLAFHDIGYMPVNAMTVAGNIPGVTARLSNGTLDGVFVQDVGDGVQHFSNGLPTTAYYTSLHYELIGYTGTATFDHAADGTPTVTGPIHEFVLAQGDLLSGQLAFNASGGVGGEMDVSMQVGGHRVGSMDISVQHSTMDISYTATGLKLSNGELVGSFVPLHTG